MGTLWRIVSVTLLLILVAACSHHTSTGPKPTEITGTWIATKMEYHSKTTPDVVDLVTAGGVGTLVLDANKTYQFTLTSSGGVPKVTTGSWSLSSDVFTLTESGMPFSTVFDISLSGTTLQLTGGDAEYDFDNNGTPEQADLNLAFTR